MIYQPNETQLQNYIQNNLSDSEAEQLELWLADHPDVMNELEMDILFKQSKAEEIFSEKNRKPFSFTELFTSRKLIPVHLFAYGLVGFLLFYVYYDSYNISQNTIATFIELEKQRGLDTTVVEVKAIKNQSLVLRFFPDSMIEKYTLFMHSKASNQQFEFNDLSADNYGSITVSLNGNKISDGEWDLIIQNNSIGEEQEFKILITK